MKSTKPATNQSSFGGIDEANPTGNLPKLKGGEHVLEISECQLINGFFGLAYVIEGKVLESTINTVGTSASVVIGGLGDTRKQAQALGRVKSFLAAVYQVDANAAAPAPDTSWQVLADDSVSADQPCAGQTVRVIAVETKTKAGFDFTAYSFAKV
jgi:hypothetical protein